MKSWLEKNDLEMYSTHNEEKSVVAERFIRTLTYKSYKFMTSISEFVYIDKLNDIVNKYNNTYHNTIKIKSVDVKSSTWQNDKDSKFKVGDIVTISTYKNIFAKGYAVNWSEEDFVIKKVKNTVPWTYVVSDLKDKKICWNVTKKNCKKQIKRSLELKK